MKIEIISKALAWGVLALAALLTMGLGSDNPIQPITIIWYPDGHLEMRSGGANGFDERYLNESQLMQLVAFDDNVIPKKAVTSSTIPSNASNDSIIHGNVASNNERFNNTSINDTNLNNTSPIWLRRWKTI